MDTYTSKVELLLFELSGTDRSQTLSSAYFLGNLDSIADYGWGCEDARKGVTYVHTCRSVARANFPGLYKHPREFRLMGVLERGLENIEMPLERLVNSYPKAALVADEKHPDILRRQLDVMAVCRNLQSNCPNKAQECSSSFMNGHRINLVFPKMFDVGVSIYDH